jgi:hypothetical protein
MENWVIEQKDRIATRHKQIDFGRGIERYLAGKGYRRDKCNNTFIKQLSNHFYDYNEIRFLDNFITINNMKNRKVTFHKKIIF